jgi:hypothetical protein
MSTVGNIAKSIVKTKAGAITGGVIGGVVLTPFIGPVAAVFVGKAIGAYLGSGGSILSAALPGVADGLEAAVGLPDLPEEVLRAKTAAVSAATDKASALSAVVETSNSASTAFADAVAQTAVSAAAENAATSLASLTSENGLSGGHVLADSWAPHDCPPRSVPFTEIRDCGTGIEDSGIKTFVDLVAKKHGGVHIIPLSQDLAPDVSGSSASIFNIVSSSDANTLASRDVQGNPDDRNIHGTRPSDGQGNPSGRDVHGNRPGNIWGWR